MPSFAWDSVLGLCLAQIAGALVFYFVLAGLSHLVFFVWRKPRDFPSAASAKGQFGLAVKWTVISLVGNAVLSTPFQWGIAHGYSRIYWTFGDHSAGWFAASIALYLVVTETLIYWTHRGLHTRFLYKHLHVFHHRFRVPTPWASLSFHPLDAFAQALPHYLCAYLFPVHGAVYLFFVSYLTLWAVMIHDRTSIFRLPGVNFTDHHTVHHVFNKDNYGQFFTFWDKVGGTYRPPSALDRAPGRDTAT
jgi:lathosterol oxidase